MRAPVSKLCCLGTVGIVVVLVFSPATSSAAENGLAGRSAISVGFEDREGFKSASGKLGIGWQADHATLALDEAEKTEGLQSLRIEPGNNEGAVIFEPRALVQRGIRFIDLTIKPAARSSGQAEAAASLLGSTVGFLVDSKGKIKVAAVNGTKAATLIDTELTSDGEGAIEQWVHLTIRQDLSRKTWDLFVDGKLSAAGLAMESVGQGQVAVFEHETAPVWLDQLTIGDSNLLFFYIDKDGMPDA